MRRHRPAMGEARQRAPGPGRTGQVKPLWAHLCRGCWSQGPCKFSPSCSVCHGHEQREEGNSHPASRKPSTSDSQISKEQLT